MPLSIRDYNRENDPDWKRRSQAANRGAHTKQVNEERRRWAIRALQRDSAPWSEADIEARILEKYGERRYKTPSHMT